MPPPRLPLSIAALLLAWVHPAHAVELFVDGSLGDDGNPGTSDAPFATIGRGLEAALAGDTVTVRAGTYDEQVVTVRDGAAGSPITVRAAEPRAATVRAPGNVLRAAHAHHAIEGLVFDGQFGPGRPIEIDTPAAGLALRGVEVMNGGNNCIDMDSPDGVTIEGATIHHCLRWDAAQSPPGPADAHGITGTGPTNLTIRDTEIYYFSGDAIQISPPRAFWDNVLVERTTMWTGPLPAAAGMFPAGTVVGENAFDSKTPASGPRPRITFRDVVAYSYTGFIANQAAFNLKENVEATIDRVTVRDSEIGFRLRGPALVTLRNAVAFRNQKSVRYEDGIADLRIVNVTFADPAAFEDGGGGGLGPGFALENGLFLGPTLPAEAAGTASNLLATADMFVDAAGDDYHLRAGAAPVDSGAALSDVVEDRDGVPRPFGSAYDVGAYEWTDLPIDPDGGAPTGAGGGSAVSGGGANGSGGNAGDDGGCGCRVPGRRGGAEGAWLAGLAVAAARAGRTRSRRRARA